MLSLNLLGPLTATLDGQPLTYFGTIRGQALMIYLAIENDRVHQREALMHLLWPAMPLKSAQGNLRQTIYLLRKALQDAGGTKTQVLSSRQAVQLNPDFRPYIDVDQFLAAMRVGSIANRREAADLYRGSFLSDFFLPESEPFEIWAAQKRAAYSRLALDNLNQLATHYLTVADYTAAEMFARNALLLDDLYEPAHRRLMEALAGQGNPMSAVTHYDQFRRKLGDEMRIEPAEATQSLVAKIRQGESSNIAGNDPFEDIPITIRGPLRPPRENLPVRTKPFIGREVELTQLSQFFANLETRLVSIIGPGGIGKTQLAIEWASKQARNVSDERTQYPDGVHFVDLASLDSPEQVVPAIAEVFAFPLESEHGSPEQQIFDYLREKTLLLILDNFEHIVESAVFVNDLLRVAPGVCILVTSRERLHLSSEQVYALQGLSYPGQPDGEEDIESFASVQLFLQSAQRMRPGFEIVAADREAIVRICHTTAGMPLAIELAAAWIDLIPLDKLALEIERHLDVLETDMRDLPERHRSIRAAIDTSWILLKPQEQRTFALLSIFRGGFTWASALAVLGPDISESDIRRRLSWLQDKSFLVYDAQKERFFVHEFLRQYGAEKLQHASKEKAYALARERHALYFVRLLRKCDHDLRRAGFAKAAKLIEIDLENALLSWNWLIANDRRSDLASIMDTFGLFLEMQGYLSIGHRHFRSLARHWQEHLPVTLQDFEKDEIIRDISESTEDSIPTTIPTLLRRDQAVGDLRFLAKTLAWQSAFELNWHDAKQLLLQSLSLLDDHRLDDDFGSAEKAFVFYRLGIMFNEFQRTRAGVYFKQALKIYQRLDDMWGAGICLLGLGYILYSDLVTGRRYLLQAIEIFEEVENVRGLVRALSLLFNAVALQGDRETVEQLFSRYMTLVANLEHPLFYTETLLVNEMYHFVKGEFALAASFVSRSINFNEDLGRDTSFDSDALAMWYLHADQFERGRAVLRQVRVELEQAAIDNDWRLAFNLHISAMLALAEKEFQKAKDYLQQALATFQVNDDVLGITGAETFTAVALIGLGDTRSGRPHLVSSLKVALDQKAINNLTETLSGIALLLAHQEDLIRSREIYELLWRVPTFRNSALYQRIAGNKICELTAALTAEDQQAIKQRFADRNIWQEAAVLLVELKAAGWENKN